MDKHQKISAGTRETQDFSSKGILPQAAHSCKAFSAALAKHAADLHITGAPTLSNEFEN